ncbi:MAG: YdeI/OmpD-associated family protein [Ignavibacteria bacterium]
MDERIDRYIETTADFAKPLLTHLRALVHKACPEIEETWKWSFPHFDYMGSNVCSMAAFKQHCSFGFWKASIMSDPEKLLIVKDKNAMGHFGRIKSLDDLPADKIMIRYIMEAAKLNKEGIKLPSRPKITEKKELEIPEYFNKALSKNKNAKKVFNEFSYSQKKEYVVWLVNAKSDETREKRMNTTIEWISEGKSLNWKYKK